MCSTPSATSTTDANGSDLRAEVCGLPGLATVLHLAQEPRAAAIEERGAASKDRAAQHRACGDHIWSKQTASTRTFAVLHITEENDFPLFNHVCVNSVAASRRIVANNTFMNARDVCKIWGSDHADIIAAAVTNHTRLSLSYMLLDDQLIIS
eukprot:1277829-Pleurochrysis_carterae.AAC.2